MMLRGGVGRYYDFAYTNANLLFPVYGAQVPFGSVYSVTNASGIRNPDGSLFQVGQPLPPNQLTNVTRAAPERSERTEDQAAVQRSGEHRVLEVARHELRARGGRRLGVRATTRACARASTRVSTAVRGASRGSCPSSGGANWRTYMQRGTQPLPQGVSVTLKRRWDGKLQLLSSYTLSEAKSSASRNATDEFGNIDVVDSFDPFNERQFGYVRTDARHRITASAVWSPAAGLTVAPIFRYRSKTPFNAITGVDDEPRRLQLRPAGGLRAHQLPARRGLHPVRPARLQEVPDQRPRRLRGHRGGIQPPERTATPARSWRT